jgi:adsorption protein B
MAHIPTWLAVVDRGILWLLNPASLAILLSSLDDLLIDLLWFNAWLIQRLHPTARPFPPGERQLDFAPRRRIAILIPLWKEHKVIRTMLEHSLSAIRYDAYEIIAGVYPNDFETQQAVRAVSRRFAHVHLALCPHDGPTSKADCLNWAFQHLLLLEEESGGERFEVIITHDAEDLIHPDELRWINYYSPRFDFIQIPVFPLATPLTALTHGVYCDEFAENHTRDMTVRARLGGFIPSAGVGTGYSRAALEKLAVASANQIFDPAALTEDYSIGLRLFRLGCSQVFIPLSRGRNVATREYFPGRWRAALRQRTRWVTGIALQGWEEFGWPGKLGEVYWLWRDRKGLIGNPLSLASNLVFAYGLFTGMWTRVNPTMARVAIVTLALQLVRLAVRMGCTGSLYGFVFALGVPFRVVYANFLNSAATCCAIAVFTLARLRGEPLKWLKTDHAYPSRAALLEHKRRLGEILVASGSLTPGQLSDALDTTPPEVRLGEHLVSSGYLSEEEVYEGLSFQQGLPRARIDLESVDLGVARALPERAAREWRVLPFQVAERSLFVAGPEIPGEEVNQALKGFTALELRFHLVTPAEFEALADALL